MTIFGNQKPVLRNSMLHLAPLSPNYLYVADEHGMHRDALGKIMRVREQFLKSLNLWNFHYPFGLLYPLIMQG